MKNSTIKTVKKTYPKIPLGQVVLNESKTISPFERANRVRMLSREVEKLSYFQKMLWARNTKPKKKGNMPIKNISTFLLDCFNVPVMRLIS